MIKSEVIRMPRIILSMHTVTRLHIIESAQNVSTTINKAVKVQLDLNSRSSIVQYNTTSRADPTGSAADPRLEGHWLRHNRQSNECQYDCSKQLILESVYMFIYFEALVFKLFFFTSRAAARSREGFGSSFPEKSFCHFWPLYLGVLANWTIFSVFH